MPGMTALGASSAPVSAIRSRRLSLTSILVPAATAVAILALALLPLLTPWFMHPALDAADSAAWLGITPDQVYGLSDRTVHDLVFTGDFHLAPPIPRYPAGSSFYTNPEILHMRDARTLLYAFLGLAVLSVALLAASVARARDRTAVWGSIATGARGLAIGVVVAGVIGFFAFEPAFELFHRIFFPGGNWAFDPATSRLVRLYPYLFWQIAAGSLGAIAVGIAALTWWFSRRRANWTAIARVVP
jgi:integral membrane protein (TIGR01906 family)